jgi:hypothetical protein
MSFYPGQKMPLFPTQRLHNVTYKHLPNGQKYITKEEITEVRLTDGYRTSETHEYDEPFHCANPYGLHRYVVVMDGDNGRVDKEKGIALCFDCLRERYPYYFRQYSPQLIGRMDPIPEPFDLHDAFQDMQAEEPLPPLEGEIPDAWKETLDELWKKIREGR